MIKWIKKNKYCELSGETSDSIKNLIRRGQIIDGIHYKKDELGRLWINIEAMDQRIELGLSKQLEIINNKKHDQARITH